MRIMLAVVSMLSTSFCAVPDLRRVEPVNASGPTTGEMAISARRAMVEPGLQDSATVVAPIVLACCRAPMT